MSLTGNDGVLVVERGGSDGRPEVEEDGGGGEEEEEEARAAVEERLRGIMGLS